jgi:hypothetical protein
VTELVRLLDGAAANGMERWLIDSAAREHPSPQLTARVRAGLGLSTSALVAHASVLSAAKLTLIAAACGVLVGLHPTEHAGSLRASVAIQPDLSEPSLLAGDLNSAPPHAQIPEPSAQADQVAHTSLDSSGADRFVRHAKRNPTMSSSDLREEIRLLDAARSAVGQHQPESALSVLDTYATRFPSGSFSQEAVVLRIQALQQRGEARKASMMAREFIAANPESPYANRAKRAVNQSGSTSPR